MKISGRKICIVISAAVIGLMLIVAVLPAEYIQDDQTSESEISEEGTPYFNKEIQFDQSVGVSMGSEILLRL